VELAPGRRPGRLPDGTRIAEEQAALGRVTTLVAGGAPPEAVFAVFAEEVGRPLEVDFTSWAGRPGRRGDRPRTVKRRRHRGARPRHPGEPRRAKTATLVFRTRRPARIDDYAYAAPCPVERRPVGECAEEVAAVPAQLRGHVVDAAGSAAGFAA
jgi:hypothetical protein